MQNSFRKVLGIDVSKDSIAVSLLTSIPDDPKNWIRKNRPQKISLGREGRDALLALDFDFAVLEPTGIYSRPWRYWLKQAERDYRLVNHSTLAHYRKGLGIASKDDNLDAFAMAMYGIEKCDRPDAWIIETSYTLSDLVAYHSHLNRQKNGIQNNLRQQLNWKCPEHYGMLMVRHWGGRSVPKRLRAIVSEDITGKWQLETCGPGIDQSLKIQASVLIAFEEAEIQIEDQITKELLKPQYEPYLRACKKCNFSEWLTVCVIAQAFPFERFLRPDLTRNTIHTYTKNNKRVHRDQSERAFKLSMGVGLILASSGDWQGWVPGGSQVTRNALFIACRAEYLAFRRYKKANANATPNEAIASIKHAYDNQGIMKAARKKVEALYRELCEEFCK